MKYLQFLNSNIPLEDQNYEIIEEFFQKEIDHLQEQQIPPIPQIKSQIQDFFKNKISKNITTPEKNEDIDDEKTESDKLKKVENLKIIEYDSPLDIVDRNNLRPGNYYIKNGELVEGNAEKRSSALYSNWHGGNADPEDITR